MDAYNQLLNLPFATLWVLGTGYLAYRLAYIGHDGPHSPVDVIFLTVVFAALAKAVMLIMGEHVILAAIPASGLAVGVAVAWRKWLGPRLQDKLRLKGLVDHDRGRSVWESMLMRENLQRPTRLVVYLKNGQRLMCDDLRKFGAAPLGPCLLGPDGSVALYVTDMRLKEQEDWEPREPFDPKYPWSGYDMTFVPAGEIECVQVSRPN